MSKIPQLPTVTRAPSPVFSVQGSPGNTARVVLSDLAASLQALYEAAGEKWVQPFGGARPVAVTVSVESFGARFAAGKTNSTSAIGHYLDAGSSMRISQPEFLSSMNFTNAVAGNNAVLQITPEY